MIAEVSMSSEKRPSVLKRMIASRRPSHIFAAQMDGNAKTTTAIDETKCDHLGISTFAMKNADVTSAMNTRKRIPI